MNKYMIAVIGMGFLTAGCSTDSIEGESKTPGKNNTEVPFSGSVVQIATRTVFDHENASQGSISTIWELSDEIGIFADGCDNFRYKATANDVSTGFAPYDEQNRITVAEGSPSYDFYAYYPYNASVGARDRLACSVPAKQFFAEGNNTAKSFMVARAVGISQLGNVELLFTNLHATLTFGLKGEGTLASMEIGPADAGVTISLAGDATCDLTAQSVIPEVTGNTSSSIKVEFTGGLRLSATETRVSIGTLPFTVPDGGLKLTFTNSDGEIFVKTVWASKNGTPIAANSQIYTLLSDLAPGDFASVPAWIGKTWILQAPATSGGSNYAYTITDPGTSDLPAGGKGLGLLTDHLDTKGYMVYIKKWDGTTPNYTRPLSFRAYPPFIMALQYEWDNTLRFGFTRKEGDLIEGTLVYGPGADGKYATFPEITANLSDPPRTLKLEALLRHIPLGNGTFSYDTASGVMKLYDADGNLYSTTNTLGTIKNTAGTADIAIAGGFTYTNDGTGKESLQLRFTPATQEFSAASYSGQDMTGLTSTEPYVLQIYGSRTTALNVYNLSCTKEVWYDLVPAE